jgi:hypothetical protein
MDSEIRWLALFDPHGFISDLSDLWTSMMYDSGSNVGSFVIIMGSSFLMVISDQVICCQLCLGLQWPTPGQDARADSTGHNGLVPADDNLRWGVVDLLMLTFLRGQKLLGRHASLAR